MTASIALAALRAHPSWYVFPILKRAKYPPLLRDNLDAASNDPAQIKTWAAQWPDSNWGLALRKSRVIVLDLDAKQSKIGRITLAKLETKHGKLPSTYIVRTPSGGFHFYFAEANGVQHACRIGVHGFGRDLDSPNYVLLAGSVLAGGALYRKEHGGPIAPSPAWFAEYLRPSNDAPDDAADQTPEVELDLPGNIARATDYLKHDARPARQGANGEHTLLMVAATLKDMGISEERSVDLLLDHYNSRCEPPWGAFDGPVADRLDVKVRNAWLYLKGARPGRNTAAADFADDDDSGPEFEADMARLRERWRKRDAAERWTMIDGVRTRRAHVKDWS